MYTLPQVTTGIRTSHDANTEITLPPRLLYFLTPGNAYQVDLSPSR